jgi:calcineurin-like phosphoesterase family protein
MRNIWVVSDTHFGHSNIIKYCDRPFVNFEEMNEKMIENWNNVVKDGDIIYHLGDVYFGKSNTSNFNHRLKGRKRLILGNHDTGKDPILLNMFEKILVWRMFPEFKLLLTHVPVHESSLEVKVLKNVHGHVHKNSLTDERYINVSVEMINYTPVNIDSLRVK